jgi:hypothetical protein
VFWQPNIFLLRFLFDAALESGDLALIKRVLVVVGFFPLSLTDIQDTKHLRISLCLRKSRAGLVDSFERLYI